LIARILGYDDVKGVSLVIKLKMLGTKSMIRTVFVRRIVMSRT